MRYPPNTTIPNPRISAACTAISGCFLTSRAIRWKNTPTASTHIPVISKSGKRIFRMTHSLEIRFKVTGDIEELFRQVVLTDKAVTERLHLATFRVNQHHRGEELHAKLLCLALVGLAAGDPPAERAEALFQAGREEFDRAAEELLARNGPAELPRGVTEVTLYPAGEGRAQTVEFLCGGWGVGPSTSYWGISHVPSDVLTGFQGAALSGWEPWDGGWLWREAGGDNRCFVRRLEPGWFCFEMRF